MNDQGNIEIYPLSQEILDENERIYNDEEDNIFQIIQRIENKISKTFNIEYNKLNEIIEDIKNIFYKNLEENEKNIFIDIDNEFINELNNKEFSDEEDFNVELIHDKEKSIKERILISMIKSRNKNNSYEIVLFVPSENDNVKYNIEKYINNKGFKDMSSKIIYGNPYDCTHTEKEISYLKQNNIL